MGSNCYCALLILHIVSLVKSFSLGSPWRLAEAFFFFFPSLFILGSLFGERSHAHK